MINGLSPSMHPDYEMQSRVVFSIGDDREFTGRIVGIAFAHVIFSYIVLLDEPWPEPGYEGHTAVPVMGSMIKRVIPS